MGLSARSSIDAAPLVVEEPGNGVLHIWRLDTSEDFLFGLFKDLFENWWDKIQYGYLIQGGVLECKPRSAPVKLGRFDGYLTVEFGDSGHLHLCIGTNVGFMCSPTAPEVSRMRLPSRVELYRKVNYRGEPTFWALRTFNSALPRPEQTLTIYLPNPLLTEQMDYADPPDWSRLALWDHLRKCYLGIDSDPLDRTAKRFTHD
jgi:hypothetical protein